MRLLKYIGGLALITSIGIYVWTQTVNRYKTPESLTLDILDAPVEVRRDAFGVPYLFASNELDLIRAQGFITAQDRLFQLEYYRLVIEGRLSEALGEDGMSQDIRARVFDLVGNSHRHAQVLNDASREYLQAYADGINAYLSCCDDDFPLELALLDMQPTPWSIENLVAVMHFVGFTHGQNINDELLIAQLVAELGSERAAQLLPLNINPERQQQAIEIGLMGWPEWTGNVAAISEANSPKRFPLLGSNNWAIGPKRTASGEAILSNDPHLDARILPGPWLPMGLFTPDIQSFGLHLPAIPGFLVGRTAHVAWGVTNGYADTQDLFVESLSDGDVDITTRSENINVKDDRAPGGVRTKTIAVRSTPRGPIVSDFPDIATTRDMTLSLRWALAEPQRGCIGIDQFLRAKSVAEFDAAVANIDVMFFNVVSADSAGAIARRASGRVPVRSSNNGAYPQPLSESWTGWIPKTEMPASMNPDDHWVASANGDMRVDDYPYYYSAHFAPTYRYRRIRQSLSTMQKASMADNWALIRDDLNLHAERIVPVLVAGMVGEPSLLDFVEHLQSWDRTDAKELVAPTIYHAMYEQLFQEVFADEMAESSLRTLTNNRYYWLERFDRMLESDGTSRWFDDRRTTDRHETRKDMILRAARRAKSWLTQTLGSDQEQWQWGKVHTVRFVSPLRTDGVGADILGVAPMPLSGSGETVRRGQYQGRDNYQVHFFDSAQFVTDFGNSDYVMGVIAGGITARQWHVDFKSLVPLWARDEYMKWWIDPALAKNHTDPFIRLNVAATTP